MRSSIVLALLIFSVSGTSAALAAKDLATVNGKSITDRDMDQALSGFTQAQRNEILKDPEARKQIVDSLIDQELMVQAAAKKGLENSPEYKTALEGFRKQFLSGLLVDKELGSQMSESAAREYYKNNRADYTTTQVRAQHILTFTKEEAQELLKKAQNPNMDFQELAEKFSRDPSAKNNRGELGFFGKEYMVPEFTNPAFAAKKDDIVGPVKTAYGWHIIKVVDRKIGGFLEYEEVELRVKSALRQQLVTRYLDQTRKSAKITRN